MKYFNGYNNTTSVTGPQSNMVRHRTCPRSTDSFGDVPSDNCTKGNTVPKLVKLSHL